MNSESLPHSESADDDRRDLGHERDESSSEKDGGRTAPLPFAPDKDDDSPLGDTDQHSDA